MNARTVFRTVARALVGLVIAIAGAGVVAHADGMDCVQVQCPSKMLLCCVGYEGCPTGTVNLIENGCQWHCDGYQTGEQKCNQAE
jgi:hypothetical protein